MQSKQMAFQRTPVKNMLKVYLISPVIMIILLTIIIWTMNFPLDSFILDMSNSRIEEDKSSYMSTNMSLRKLDNAVDEWVQISENMFPYSAFIDDRFQPPIVRIVGAICGKKRPRDLTCSLRHNESSSTVIETVIASSIKLGENYDWNCEAVHFICKFQSQLTSISMVSIARVHSSASQRFNQSWMTIRNAHVASSNAIRIALCVRPAFGFNHSFRMAEFIAYYETLGVYHFTFYDFHTGKNVLKYLERLKANHHSIEVLPWTLPKDMQNIFAFGERASVQDCIYRNMYRASHVMLVDVDEFATPRRNKTLKEVIQYIDEQGQDWNIMYLRSAAFCLEAPPREFANMAPFVTQSYVYRESSVFPLQVRSKYIMKPQYMIIGSIHSPLQMIGDEKQAHVDETTILLHYYRENLCQKGHDIEIDVTARRYHKELQNSSAFRVWMELFHADTKANASNNVYTL